MKRDGGKRNEPTNSSQSHSFCYRERAFSFDHEFTPTHCRLSLPRKGILIAGVLSQERKATMGDPDDFSHPGSSATSKKAGW